MKLNTEKITEIIPIPNHLYDCIDSTNNEAKRRAQFDRGYHLYATQRQTAGRGRRGHDFYSPDTGLYMTLSLRVGRCLQGVQKITCAAAVAVCEAVEELSDKRPQIKWVNDIFVGGKKAAGILTELLTDSQNRPRAVIVGIGLNLTTNDFPDQLADIAGSFGEIEVNALCGRIAAGLISYCESIDDISIIEKYKLRNLCIDRTISYRKDGTLHKAKAVDIDADGGLIVEENGEITTLNSGEISVIL